MTKKNKSAKKAIRDIRRATGWQYSEEKKIRLVLDGRRAQHCLAVPRVKHQPEPLLPMVEGVLWRLAKERRASSEKREIVDLVERSSLPVRRTLNQLGISKSTLYDYMNETVKAAMAPWWTDNRVERSCTAPRDAYWAG